MSTRSGTCWIPFVKRYVPLACKVLSSPHLVQVRLDCRTPRPHFSCFRCIGSLNGTQNPEWNLAHWVCRLYWYQQSVCSEFLSGSCLAPAVVRTPLTFHLLGCCWQTVFVCVSLHSTEANTLVYRRR